MSDSHTPPAAAPPEPEAAEAHARRKRLGWTYWAGLLFGLVCILLGLVGGIWGTRIMPPPLPPAPAVLPTEPGAARAPSRAAVRPAAPGSEFDPASDTYALEQRLAQVTAASRARDEAAQAALAVAALTQAADRGAAFSADVEARRAELPASPDLEALRALAQVGAPTRASLSEGFAGAAARAAAAARQAEPPLSWRARLVRLVSGVFALRRTDRLTGPGVDAALARAERAVQRGDLASAVRETGALPAPARAAMAPWPDQAGRRLAIERRLAALRSAALASLAAAERASG